MFNVPIVDFPRPAVFCPICGRVLIIQVLLFNLQPDSTGQPDRRRGPLHSGSTGLRGF